MEKVVISLPTHDEAYQSTILKKLNEHGILIEPNKGRGNVQPNNYNTGNSATSIMNCISQSEFKILQNHKDVDLIPTTSRFLRSTIKKKKRSVMFIGQHKSSRTVIEANISNASNRQSRSVLKNDNQINLNYSKQDIEAAKLYEVLREVAIKKNISLDQKSPTML